MSKSQTRTFAIQLQDGEAAIVTISTTGCINEFPDNRVEILDSNGYLLANLKLAMDATKRVIHPRN